MTSRFEVVKTLGAGASGVVVLATDQLLGRQVAIKILRSNELAHETAQKRFIREAKLLATIDHPSIVKILASDITANGYPYHVMEYLEGAPLSDRLKGAPLPFDQFCQIMIQVCAGLDCAHSAGVIHRDLKPSNIFVCKEHEGKSLVKIIDFGMSKAEDDSTEQGNITKTNAVMGSPTYMSPEQCKGKSASAASDIYSLACIMYECVTGAPPHQAETAYEVMYKHINEKTASLTLNSTHAIGQSLGQLIDSCLVKDPAQRPSDLKKISDEIAEISKTEMKNVELFRKKREHKTVLLLLAAILFAGGVLGVSLHYMQQEKNKNSAAANASLEQEIAADQERKLEQIRKRIEIQKERLVRTKNEAERDIYAFRLIDSFKDMYEQIRVKKELTGVPGLAYFRKHPNDQSYIALKKQALAILDEEYPFTERSNSTVKMRQQLFRNKADTLIELDKVDEALDYCDRALKSGSNATLEASEVLSSRAVCYVLLGEYGKALKDVDAVDRIFAGVLSGSKETDDRFRKTALKHGVLLSEDWRGKQLAIAGIALELNPPVSSEDKLSAANLCCSIISAWLERAVPDPHIAARLLDNAEAYSQDLPDDQRQKMQVKIEELREKTKF